MKLELWHHSHIALRMQCSCCESSYHQKVFNQLRLLLLTKAQVVESSLCWETDAIAIADIGPKKTVLPLCVALFGKPECNLGTNQAVPFARCNEINADMFCPTGVINLYSSASLEFGQLVISCHEFCLFVIKTFCSKRFRIITCFHQRCPTHHPAHIVSVIY